MPFAVDCSRLLATIRSTAVKRQVLFSVVAEQWTQTCVRKSLDALLLLEIGHFLACCFQTGRCQRNPASGSLTANASLHVEFLSTSPQSAHFSIARVFDDGKAVAMFDRTCLCKGFA